MTRAAFRLLVVRPRAGLQNSLLFARGLGV